MLARLRLLKGANVFLYFGPLLAGMAGLGWGIVAPFVAIFVLWLMLWRPEQWPATNAEWMTGRALGAALTQILSQVLLVTILMGIGRGLAGLADILPALHPLLPLGLSLMAIPISRMVWDPRRAAELGVFLDEDAAVAQAPHAAAEAAGAVASLLALPDDATEDQLRPRIAEALDGPAAAARLDALLAALASADRSHAALRRALVIWATEPEVVAPGQIPDTVASAFALAGRNPDLLRLFLPRAIALAAAFPDRMAGFPAPAQLRDAAAAGLASGPDTDLPADLRADLADGLAALARAVEAALTPQRVTPEPARRDPAAQRSPRPA
jgi:hypothetical protein